MVILVVCLYFVWRVAQGKPKPNEDKRTKQATQISLDTNPASGLSDTHYCNPRVNDQLMLHLYALY